MPYEMNNISLKVTEKKCKNKPLKGMRTNMREANEKLASQNSQSKNPQMNYFSEQVKSQMDPKTIFRNEIEKINIGRRK